MAKSFEYHIQRHGEKNEINNNDFGGEEVSKLVRKLGWVAIKMRNGERKYMHREHAHNVPVEREDVARISCLEDSFPNIKIRIERLNERA